MLNLLLINWILIVVHFLNLASNLQNLSISLSHYYFIVFIINLYFNYKIRYLIKYYYKIITIYLVVKSIFLSVIKKFFHNLILKFRNEYYFIIII